MHEPIVKDGKIKTPDKNIIIIRQKRLAVGFLLLSVL